MANLNVNIGDLRLKNPVMTASGTFGYGPEFADFVPLEEIGGIIVKGTTLNPREGNAYPRMVETASGMLNCVGLQNKGVDYFCKNIYPEIKDIDTLNSYLEANNIDVGIICVPRINAQKVADMLVKGGVKGIWNFAPVDLIVPDDIKVENVHLSESFLTLVYLMKDN